jgi:hypothetical protein
MLHRLALHQFYMKLWHASGEVSSTSEFELQYIPVRGNKLEGHSVRVVVR